MICADCGVETEGDPCERCGRPALLDGRYRLDRVLGRGTTGTTFAAVRLADGLNVAVKEMPLRQADTEKGRELLRREVRVLRQLHHAQIPGWIDDLVVGQGKHASLYLVIEFIDGVDLAHELEQHRYDEREVLDVVIGLLPVLIYLHNLSPPVIHRDIKPRNVIRRSPTGAHPGELVLLDFGAVRDAVADIELGGSTVAGTFGYMAPEQFRGDASAASDIYAVGALAVALLTRREPHTLADANGILVWAHHARVSPAVARLLGRMLDRDARRRPSDAAALLTEVKQLRASLDAAPPPPAPVPLEDAPRPTRIAPTPAAFEPAQPFEPPAVQLSRERHPKQAQYTPHAPLQTTRAARPALLGAGLSGAGCMMLAGFLVATAGAVALVMQLTPSEASSVPTFPAPVLPAPSCTIKPHVTQTSVPSNTSRFEFVGASEDGSRVALALGRQADQRAEVIVYQAGSRTHVAERILKPSAVPSDWSSLLQKLVDDNADVLTSKGIQAAIQPAPVEWCQSGDAVQIGDQTWSFRTFSESCDLGFGENTSYQLCPPGASDASACVVPPRLRIGCWDDAPRLVDVFTVGDAVWAVAERPHGSTTPRFAAGVMK